MSCSVPIRQILQVPETFRAVPQKKTRRRFQRPDPDLELIKRQQYLQKTGVDAELRYDRLTRSWYVRYCSDRPIDWPAGESAADTWRRVVGV